ncbi:hypothetical protein N7495_002965 [Penicillium taxi]|uniref:uncharacterized protein n=1 Tax=Penicillium taxi TaxID=168475 RepID=UPI0025458038|nr:uncharacterized protein N7495_002965 [Penicillium taxi]KAJ5902437.1 hypothetical protein N7495_002965 [Penicillium taxi]
MTRSFLGKCLLYGVAFHLWTSFVLVRFDDDTHDTDAPPKPSPETTAHPSHRRVDELVEEEEETESNLFVPLTWSRLQEGELYAASDPEWKEFVQISKDQKKLKQLRSKQTIRYISSSFWTKLTTLDDLATIVLKTVSSQISPQLGGPLSLTGFWLVHQFPHRAPPAYLRSGIAITDDGVSWVTKPMDTEDGDRLQTFMKPVHVALAIKDAYLVLIKRQLARLRGETPHPLELLRQVHTLTNATRIDTLKQQPSSTEELSSESVSSTKDTKLHPSTIISSLGRLPLPDLGPGSDLHLASLVFRLSLAKHRASAPRTPLRGNFFISGPVGVKGSNGFCRYEVRGEYDPVKSSWRTIDIQLRDVNFRRQRALGQTNSNVEKPQA